MEDDMFPRGKWAWYCFLFVDSWHWISFGDVLGLKMLLVATGLMIAWWCLMNEDVWILSGTLVQLTGWDCGRWSLILPQAESGPGSTGKGRDEWIWMNMIPDHGFTSTVPCQMHNQSISKHNWGSGRGQMQLSIFQERSSFSTRFRSTKRWQAFRQVRLRRSP